MLRPTASHGTAKEIARRLREGVRGEPVFAGETRKSPGDKVISSIGGLN